MRSSGPAVLLLALIGGAAVRVATETPAQPSAPPREGTRLPPARQTAPLQELGENRQSPMQCGLVVHNNTLGYLPPDNTTYWPAKDAAECCGRCAKMSECASWSFQHQWPASPPCHTSSMGFLKKQANSPGNVCGTARQPAPSPRPPLRCKHSIPGVTPPPPRPPSRVPPNGVFVIDTSPGGRRQVFEGVQVELQADSIGSGNGGMPKNGTLVPDNDASTTGAPHDLTAAERARFAKEVLQGVRTVRLALGLFLRGLGPRNKTIVGRWPSQMAELKQLQDLSRIEGWAAEYWSPAPAWKSTHSYYGGTLASFNTSFLEDFAASVATDARYLLSHGLRLVWWGLQNEPGVWTNTTSCAANPTGPGSLSRRHGANSNSYSKCEYTQCSYYAAFKACARAIKQLDPSIRIHANSDSGQVGAAPIANSPETMALLDAFTWHVGAEPSGCSFGNRTRVWAYGKPAFVNEMEWQPENAGSTLGTARGTVAFVNVFLNWLVYRDSPTGNVVIHAIKPTTNSESVGYGWAWWRPTGANASAVLPELLPNHFDYNYYTWPAVAPFTRTVPCA